MFGSSTNYLNINLDGLNTILIGAAVVAVIFIGLILAGMYIVNRIKEAILKQKGLNLAFFEVKLPQSNETEIKAAEQMFTGLIGLGEKLKGLKKIIGARKFVSFEIVAFREVIKFYVVCPEKIAPIIDRQINGTYPSAEILRVKEYNLFPEEGNVAYASLKLDKDQKIPVQTYEELPVDTISTLTDAMSKLQDNEAGVFQLVISPAGSDWRNSAKDFVKKLREPPKEGEKKPSKPKFNDDTISLIDKKAEKSGFYADVRIVVVSESKYSADSHLINILSTFDQYTKEAGNRFKKVKDNQLKKIVDDVIYRIPRETMILNTAELATLFHFPNKNIKTPYVKWLLSKKAPAPDFVTSTYDKGYMYVGKNIYRGQTKEVFLRPEDRLRHFYIIGQTGTGKSGLMSGMMIRDMKLGHGCAYIDPHGSDAEKILQQVPPERVEDVVIFDPADLERPVGLNMLEFHSTAQKTLVTNEMLNIFDTLYNLKVTGGPMFEQYMRYAIMLLTEDTESGSTLLEIPKIFVDQGYRDYKISKCKDQEVIDFWKKQAEQAGGEASLKNIVPYVVSKFTAFLSNDYVRPIIAQQESTINFRKIMDEQKILIVRLSKGKIGDFNANLLGMIIIGKILIGSLEREGTAEKDRKPFYLYIDEFQNFLTDGIMIILSEARKYKLSLTLAHQFIGQLTREGNNTKIRDAIFGNVGNKAILRIGEEDASFLRKVVGEDIVEERDLQQIENFTYYIKMLVDGRPTPAFTARSFYGESPYDLIGQPNPEIADIARQISRLKYGKDRAVIENEVKLRGTFIKEKTEDEKKDKGGMFGGFGGF
jgi:hypothetical protein